MPGRIRMLVAVGMCFACCRAAAACLGEQPGVVEKAVAIVRSGRPEAALAELKRGLQSNPRNPELLNAAGATMCLLGETEGATKYFRAALSAAPAFTPAKKNLALALVDLGRLGEAETLLRELESARSTRAFAEVLLGVAATQRGEHRLALDMYRKAGEALWGLSSAVIGYSRSLQRSGDRKGAEETLRRLPAPEHLSPRDRFEAARLYADLGMMEKALGFVPAGATGIAEKRLRMELLAREGRSQEALDLGLELSNSLQDPAFLSLKAALADASKQPQLAADTLRQAIQLFPNREESYLDLSRLCSKYGDHKLAGEILDLGLRRIPDSFRLLVQKGITLETAGNRDQAKALFEKAAGAHPNQPVPAAALAVIQLLSEETSEAKATIFQALGRFPDDYYLHYLLGCVIEKEGTGAEGGEEWRVAVKAFETSVRLNPSFGPAHHSLGKLLARSAPEKAALHFESAIRQNPNALAAKYQLGRLYLELGRKEEGTRLLAEVEKRKAETLEREQSLSLPASRTQ